MNLARGWLALLLLWPVLAAGQQSAPALEGVWGATRYFGPAVRGTLEISGSGPAARARIARAVVREATGRPVMELFEESVARPLQFDRYYFNLQPTGEPYLGGGAKLLPRDFMKFGQVMLEGGTWNGTRIIPRDFARTAGSPLMTLRNQRAGMHYGYLWWTIDYQYQGRTITAYFASGNGGNVVVVVPDADLVIACFGGNYNARAGWAVVTEHIPKYILGAVKK